MLITISKTELFKNTFYKIIDLIFKTTVNTKVTLHYGRQPYMQN